MKKKFIILFLSIACALCFAFAFAGCTDENGESLWGGTNTQQGETGGSDNTDDSGNTGDTGGGHVHNYGNLIPATPATCAEEGLQAHYYCSGCQKYFNDQKVEKSLSDLTIPALGHILEENQLVCKTCNEQLAESLTFELNSDNTYKLTSGTPTSGGKIMIPKIYNNLPVTSIGDRAFWGCTSLENITLPNSVTSIGWGAFQGCESLESITIPNSVTSIGLYAFDECTNLKGVYITDIAAWCNIDFEDDDSNPLYYAHNLYLNNQPVTNLTAEMLQGVTTIKGYAFAGFGGTNITIPDSFTYITWGAFCYCANLKNITIPDSVTEIGGYAFAHCTSLTNISIPDSVTFVGDGAFYNCTNLTSITIPDSVTSIDSWAFYNCTVLETIEIPDSVTSIGYGAFYKCTSLTSINIDSVTSIGDSAFYECTSLTSITIPDSVTSIGEDAFENCTNLENITVTDGNTAYSSQDGILYNKNKTQIIFVPKAIKGVVTLPNSVTSIGIQAFDGCTSLESITIPDSVTSIDHYAFDGCTSLESITIGNGVVSIGWRAFDGCTNLTSITVAEGNTAYSSQDGIFYNKDKTELIKVPQTKSSINIPDSVTSIGSSAFQGCTNLESVYITDIAAWCNIDFGDITANPLWYAHNLYLNNNLVTELTAEMLQGVTTIKSNAFSNCGLTSITIPDSVTSIGEYAFGRCESLTSITIPDSVTSIGDGAFSYCTSLTSISIPDSVTSIGYYAFGGCTSLESITIPDSVTSIGYAAFQNCANLKNITFNNPNGWYYKVSSSATSGTDIPSEDLKNPETAATYLKDTYINYYWKRKTT